MERNSADQEAQRDGDTSNLLCELLSEFTPTFQSPTRTELPPMASQVIENQLSNVECALVEFISWLSDAEKSSLLECVSVRVARRDAYIAEQIMRRNRVVFTESGHLVSTNALNHSGQVLLAPSLTEETGTGHNLHPARITNEEMVPAGVRLLGPGGPYEDPNASHISTATPNLNSQQMLLSANAGARGQQIAQSTTTGAEITARTAGSSLPHLSASMSGAQNYTAEIAPHIISVNRTQEPSHAEGSVLGDLVAPPPVNVVGNSAVQQQHPHVTPLLVAPSSTPQVINITDAPGAPSEDVRQSHIRPQWSCGKKRKRSVDQSGRPGPSSKRQALDPESQNNQTHEQATTERISSGLQEGTQTQDQPSPRFAINNTGALQNAGHATPELTASSFCHICTRKQIPGHVKVCSNLTTTKCRKVLCFRCGADQGYEVDEWKADSSWTCPHCRKVCPERAQCHTYKRVNQRRTANRRRAAVQPRTNEHVAGGSNDAGLQ